MPADTHRHRLGANYHHLPVNCPFAAVRTHQRDGPMCIFSGGSETSYFTGVKSSGGAQTVTPAAGDAPLKVTGVTGRFDATPADPDADFVQPRECARPLVAAPVSLQLPFSLSSLARQHALCLCCRRPLRARHDGWRA